MKCSRRAIRKWGQFGVKRNVCVMVVAVLQDLRCTLSPARFNRSSFPVCVAGCDECDEGAFKKTAGPDVERSVHVSPTWTSPKTRHSEGAPPSNLSSQLHNSCRTAHQPLLPPLDATLLHIRTCLTIHRTPLAPLQGIVRNNPLQLASHNERVLCKATRLSSRGREYLRRQKRIAPTPSARPTPPTTMNARPRWGGWST